MKRTSRFACCLAGVLAGCGTDSGPAGPGDDVPGYTDAREAAIAWSAFLGARDEVRLERLLEPESGTRAEAGFRYHLQPADAGRFPWVTGGAWGRAEELDMLGNLMDATFVSPEVGTRVESLDVALAELTTTVTDEGTRITATATIAAWWTDGGGAVADVHLSMLLVRDARGYFVLREIREAPSTGGHAIRDDALEPVTFATLKALFRTQEAPGMRWSARGALIGWARALAERDYAALERLLEPGTPDPGSGAGFHFFPPSSTVDDFPWMEGDSWSRPDELHMMANMTDPEYSGVLGAPVSSIRSTLDILTETKTPDGVQMRVAVTVLLVFGKFGAAADTRLDVLVVRDGSGWFVLRWMRELPSLLIAADEPPLSPDPAPWSHLKAFFW